MSRRSWPVVVVGVFLLGTGARALVLAWSPLPATLDGFRYARLARTVVETGSVLATGVQSDELVTTLLLALGSVLTGVRPLYLAQPLVAILGGASGLSAIVLVRDGTRSLGWSTPRTKAAAVVAAVGFALSGLYLRRTGVPDEEALGLLLLPLFALAAFRLVGSRRAGWAIVFATLALAYPPLHNLSSVVAAFTLTALVAVAIGRSPTRSTVLAGGGMVGLFWSYFFLYYGAASWLGLALTYSGLFRDYPGVLVAWLVALAIGVVWLQTTSKRTLRCLLTAGVGGLFLIAGVNAITPVFPGTIATPTVVGGLVALYVLPAGLAIVGVTRLRGSTGDGVVVALFFGPLALTWFMLTTALTPAFFGALQRVQVHVHVALFVLAAIGAAGIRDDHETVGRVLLVGLVVVTVLTAPLAFLHLDTATAPRTVHASEFAAVSFASTGGTYASDHRLGRVGPLYYGDEVTGSVAPTRRWLRGGEPPPCLTLAQRSWTRGAHFYPLPPEHLSEGRLDRWITGHNLVYSVDGSTRTYAVFPRESTASC